MKKTASIIVGVLLLISITGCTSMGQHISEVRAVPNISVQVTYIGGVFWELKVRNNSGETAMLIWDESAYINSEGKSTRFIRGNTRKIHSGQAQPPSPIPPNALLVEKFTGEAWVEIAGTGIAPRPTNPSQNARMYISFEVGGKKYAWEGSVAFIPVSPQK